ncbi:MFS general substrate transporter [Amniculicola lignicola CBS 123094]|uniref:MFS general substrate transporter n=1 Tax=Amniculicola lignicola CBS 123094 TaxID=1392246 RepID=A0A6A5WVE1_9PLEO|nr:MFS general substrate transporter [Amniculicola lignicola CBS 123094]
MGHSKGDSKDDGQGVLAGDERTPLLAVAPVPIATYEGVETENGIFEEDHNGNIIGAPGVHDYLNEDAPLPFWQIMLLCYTRVVEPIAFFSIFPYIQNMIEDLGGIDEDSVGFYSGLIESLFSATQMCVMIFWGKASDRYGRKPVLVFSLIGVSASTALFGMSTKLWHLFFFRCLAGVFAGTIVTVRAMFTENSTKKTQARAFSYFAFAGNMGILFGPLLGGALEHPAKKYAFVFGNSKFLKHYPYALPGFVCGAIGASSAILTILFVKETLHIHHSKKLSETAAPMSTWELVKYPGVARVMIVYNYIALLAFAYTSVNPLFLFTPVHLGGIGFPPELIAAAIALAGISQALWLLFAFPPLHKRIGTGNILRICAAVWPFFFAASPILNFLLRHEMKIAFWALGPLTVSITSGVAMAFTANQLAVNDIAPTHESFGTLNALVLAVTSGLRAVVPWGATSMYAVGVKYHIFSGQLFWVVIILIAIGLTPLMKIFPKEAEGKAEIEEDSEA